MTRHCFYYSNVGSAFNWSCRVENLLQQSEVGSDGSSVWNFYTSFFDAISWEACGGRREMSDVFSG